MANAFSYQVLKDDTQSAVIKLTGLFDGSGQEENIARIQANTLYGALDANNVPWITIRNPSVNANTNGDISIHTRGQVANASYTIILELRKDNAYYQRGQFNDPAAFNYPPYSITP